MNFCLAAIIAVFLFLVYEPVRYIFNKSIDAAQGVSIHDGAFYSIMAAVAAILDMVLIGYGWLYGRSQWVLQSDGSMTVVRNHRVCNIDDAVGLLKLGTRDPFVLADVIFFLTAVMLLVAVFLGSRRMAIPHILAKMITIITQVVTLCVYLDPLYSDTLSRSPLENTLLSLAMLVLEIRMLLYTLSFYDYDLEYECLDCPQECEDADVMEVAANEDIDSGVYAEGQSQMSYGAPTSPYAPHAVSDRSRIYEDLDNIPERDTPYAAQRSGRVSEVRRVSGGNKRRLSFEDERPRSAVSAGQATRRHSQESGRSKSFFSAAQDAERGERRGSKDSGRSRSVHSVSRATGRRTSKEGGSSIIASNATGATGRRTSGQSIIAAHATGRPVRKTSGQSIIASHATGATGRRTSGQSIIASNATGATGRRTSGQSIIAAHATGRPVRKTSGQSVVASQATGAPARRSSKESGNAVSVYNVSHRTGRSDRRNPEDSMSKRSVDASLKKISKDIHRIERSLSVKSDLAKNDARSLTRSSRHLIEDAPPSKAGGGSARSISKGGGGSATSTSKAGGGSVRSTSSGHTRHRSVERGSPSQAKGHESRDRSHRGSAENHDRRGGANRGGISHVFSAIPSFEPNHDDDFSVYVPFRSVSDFADVQRLTGAPGDEEDTASASQRRVVDGKTSRAGDDVGGGASRRRSASGSKTLTTITERSDRSSVLSDKGSRTKRDHDSTRSSSSKRSKH